MLPVVYWAKVSEPAGIRGVNNRKRWKGELKSAAVNNNTSVKL